MTREAKRAADALRRQISSHFAGNSGPLRKAINCAIAALESSAARADAAERLCVALGAVLTAWNPDAEEAALMALPDDWRSQVAAMKARQGK